MHRSAALSVFVLNCWMSRVCVVTLALFLTRVFLVRVCVYVCVRLQMTTNRYYTIPTWNLVPGALGFTTTHAEARQRALKTASSFTHNAALREMCQQHPHTVHSLAFDARDFDAAAVSPYDLPDLAALLTQSRL